MSRRKPPTPWEACGQTREEYEAWEKREFRAACAETGIDPDAPPPVLVDEMERVGMLSSNEAAAVRAAIAAKDGAR